MWVWHPIDSHPFGSMSIGPPIPELWLFSKIWPWNSKVKVMGEVTVQSHNVGLTSYRHTSLLFHVNRPSHSWNTASSKNDLETQGQGQMTLMLHNYRSRQFHRTSNGINPSSGSKDMGSTKSGPSAAWFDKFLAHGQAHMGQMGVWAWQCTTTGLDNSIELRTEKIHQAVTEIWVPQVWQPPAQPPARPDRDDNTPPARRAEG